MVNATPMMLFLLKNKTLRFNELFKGINGITQKMLTQQLRELEADQVVERMVYPEVPPRVEYSITQFGKTLVPIFDLMYDWGKAYQARVKKTERSE